jgi:hypothetical protein
MRHSMRVPSLDAVKWRHSRAVGGMPDAASSEAAAASGERRATSVNQIVRNTTRGD